MCDPIDTAASNKPVTTITHAVSYGDECLEQQIIRQLGADGELLSGRHREAHAALVAALGPDGLAALDAYVCASTELSCAREEAVMAICVAASRS